MSEKTMAMKLLDQRKIPYEVVTYPKHERDAEVLALLYFDVEPASVFKTLVVQPAVGKNKKPMLVLVPADQQLDLKKLAKVVGVKKLKLATHHEAEEMTGLQVGGISPLVLLNQGFTIFADSSIEQQDAIYVSSGEKGINLCVPRRPLVDLIKARIADVT